jgi:DNA-binding MarR family transcriptional regulator
VSTSLSYDLHVLTARLDRSADRILGAELGIPYRRYLALLMVGDRGATTQRALADALGVTEPSVSRMTSVLVQEGFLNASPDPAGGNRRQLTLTPRGRSTVQECRALLDVRFDAVVQRSGIPRDEYARQTQMLLGALEREVSA